MTETKWARSVDAEITPRFPDGLTVFNTVGQWRDTERKTIVREPSKIVMIVLPGKDDDSDRLNQIAEAYQEPVSPAVGRGHAAAGLRLVLTSVPIPKFARFRARSDANFGIRRDTSNVTTCSAGFGFEVPKRTRRKTDRNFKSTALGAKTYKSK